VASTAQASSRNCVSLQNVIANAKFQLASSGPVDVPPPKDDAAPHVLLSGRRRWRGEGGCVDRHETMVDAVGGGPKHSLRTTNRKHSYFDTLVPTTPPAGLPSASASPGPLG
jgi:hypothetical protein